ncbi:MULTISPECIES: PepSY domain-containing protein [unclassified Fusobacterium]|uniref:PepSY domain-containing protein n=1 Tax=unclassified Fusobacterium TaxID=2648384 RepID=UPI001B8AEB7E|nr:MULTISPECIES: PepSY domain-containing protein [unclassified Fusobacterium]MBR8701603.1 hypothetical protein [Fusobacterium sp. DD45]MBR8711384.1 hypothetical protein [Fusobacterium sp. DD28]MBR8751950.1 hypothetical protein [Fusobacterium sp. DD26]
MKKIGKTLCGLIGGFILLSAAVANEAYGNNQRRLLTEKEAVKIALDNSPNWKLKKIETEIKKGKEIYEVVLVHDRDEKEYLINARTGEIVKYEVEDHDDVVEYGDIKISFEDAIKIALDKSDNGVFKKVEIESKRGKLYYDVEVLEPTKKKEYRIDVEDGQIISTKIENR